MATIPTREGQGGVVGVREPTANDDTGIQVKNIHAAEALHFAEHLEETRLVSAVDRLIGLYREGLAPIGAASDGAAAQAALLWIQDPDPQNQARIATALAESLGMSLLRVDLATVASPYIKETEKNLDRVFDAARDADALLLFDEADALLDGRSEVRDAHDRYAFLDERWLRSRLARYERPVAVIAPHGDRGGGTESAALRLEGRTANGCSLLSPESRK